MSDIIINVDALVCETPVMGTIYRQNGYMFNWQSVWDDYVVLGINATIRLFYASDGMPEQEYQGSFLPLPGNADMYHITDVFGGFDQTNFRIVFEVPDSCTFTFTIPYSEVVS
jgi:hypothetical protein